MLPGDRLVCVLVKPLAAGSRFTSWPLHLTVVPWFRIPLNSDDVCAGLQEATQDMQPFTAVMDGEAHFGRGGRKLVSLVALPDPITRVEQTVRAFLKSQKAWLVDETTRRRQPYRPHVRRRITSGCTAGTSCTVTGYILLSNWAAQKLSPALWGLRR